MKHPHAHILQAIAEDKDTEIEVEVIGITKPSYWADSCLGHVANSPFYKYRIKPKPFIVNGVECPRPVDRKSHRPSLTVIADTFQLAIPRRVDYYFATDADLMKVFDALVKPFEEQGK